MSYKIRGSLLFMAIILAVTMVFFNVANEASADQEGTFSGTWTASGQWQPLDFEAGREVFTFKLSGHVNLKNEAGEFRDFWSDCVGLWDSQTGGTARCVWRDPDGEKEAYIVLDGQLVKEDVKVTGQLVGGTGTLKGLTGTMSFTWSSIYRNKTDRILTGYTKDLNGSYRIPTAGN